MTQIRAGVVDVVVIRQLSSGWRILVLKRARHLTRGGSWEIVHGTIEKGEKPGAAALREVREESGLEVRTLYSITVNPFYVPQRDRVELALVFAAFVDSSKARVGTEHEAHQWLTMAQAARRLTWPREVEVLQHCRRLLRTGDAGNVDDVLRVFG